MTPYSFGWRDLLPRPWDAGVPPQRSHPAGWDAWVRSMPIDWDRLNERLPDR